MANLRVELYQGQAVMSALAIQHGESIDLDLQWVDTVVAGSTVKVTVLDSSGRSVYEQTLVDQGHLAIAGSVTKDWATKATYRTEVWLTEAAGAVRSGAFLIRVE